LSKATAPTNVGSGGNLKAMKGQAEEAKKDSKDAPSTLQVIGDNSAGFLLKQSDKNDWTKRWFVLNEKTCKLAYTKKPEERNFRGVIALDECILEDGPEKENGAEEANGKSSKSKKASNGTAEDPTANLIFRVSHKVAYKTVLKAHHSLILKAENMAEKLEWMSKIRACLEPPGKGGSAKDSSIKNSTVFDSSLSRSTSTDSSVEMSSVLRRPTDPEEDLRLMAQEVRDYVEAVLNSLAANVPKAVVLCQVERAKDAMLNQLYSSISVQATGRIEELLQEDQEVKARRERCHKQAAALTKLTKQLSLQEARTAVSSGFQDSSESKTGGMPEAEDWRVAFEEAATTKPSYSNSPSRTARSASPLVANGRHISRSSNHGDGDENGDAGSISRRTPGRLPPPPPPTGAPMYKY